MHLSTLYLNVYKNYKFATLLKPKIKLCTSNYNYVILQTTRGFYATSTLKAKSHQEKENEYAHSVMSNINSYSDTLVRYPLEIVNDSNGVKEIGVFSEIPSGDKKGEFSETRHLVFVYGTLKQNEPNHDFLRESSRGTADFVSVGRTAQKWPLVIASRYNIPYLLYCEGVGKHVAGEIYKVDDQMLSSMDDFECHPKYYTRLPVAVECPEGTLRPWVYFLKNYKAHLLELPVIENYSSKGSHGLEYVSRYKRSPAEKYYYEVQNV